MNDGPGYGAARIPQGCGVGKWFFTIVCPCASRRLLPGGATRCGRSLARLAQGEMSVNELARPFKDQPARRAAQARPCQLQAGPLREVAAWVEHHRRHWEGSLDRLDDYLREWQATPSTKPKTKETPP